MEISRATALTWSHTVSPSLHLPQPLLFTREARRFRVWCGTDQSSKGDQMIISVTGATGFIGKRLVQKLQAENHRVHVLTRSKSKAELIFPVKDFPGVKIAGEPEWKDCIQGSTGVVNLAGLPISTRWSSEIKKEIKESRVRVTSKVVDLIKKAPDEIRPKVLVSATAVGYYGTSETQVFDEQSPSGKDYLAEVCREWESTALKANGDVRVALIRIGVVLGKDGGALAKMIPLFMMFAGGPLGSGNQWFSWIHLDDIVNLIYEALSNPSYKGVINGTAPNPVRLSELCEQLGNVLGRPSWPAFSTATMSSRPYHRGHRRGYSGRSYSVGRDQLATGDDHLQSVRDSNSAIRRGESENVANQTRYHQNPSYDLHRHPPPSFYYQNPPYNPRPHPPPQYQNPSYNPRPHPPPLRFRPPYDNRREFRPQQNFSKPADYREWENALTPPPSRCERFKVLSYNILADYLAMDHWRKLYYHIPSYMLNWQWRKSKIILELGLWSADIMCLQEVDRFHELEEDLKFKGYRGIWKMRTGNPVDGCAIFWRTSRFNLVYEECIEFNKLGLRDNVAQICVLECINQNGSLPPRNAAFFSLTGSRKVVICNIHVLYNPNRGEIKLGQVRVLLDKAQAVSQLWNNAPVIMCGDFNCTPKSPLYNFIAEQKLDLSGIDRDKVSGQASAVIRAPWTYGPKASERRSANVSVQAIAAEGDKEVTIEQNSSSSDMQNPVTESSSLDKQNTRSVVVMSDKRDVQCSRETDTCAGEDTQEAVDHNKIFDEVDGTKEGPNPSYNKGINDDEIHDVTPITSSTLETVHTDPTGMRSTERISDSISATDQESSSEKSNLHDHKGTTHVESDCSPTSLQEGDQASKAKIDIESTDLVNLEVSSNKPSSNTSVSDDFDAPHPGYRESSSYEAIANDQMNSSSTEYLVDKSHKITNIDFLLNEKLEKFSFDEIDQADVNSGNIGEDAVDFINALHTAREESNDTEDDLSPSLMSKSIDAERTTYNPSLWTPAEIETATGNAECTFLEHPLSLRSTYTEAMDSSGTRDPNGEPLVTSYNKCFLGTVDYIWRSEGLQTTRVLAPIPKRVMESTQGYPTKKWGSDHIALVSELAFLEDGTAISKDAV